MKPGQLLTINNVVYQAKKRTAGCDGCYFKDTPLMCPAVVIRGVQKINCILYGIILKKL